MDLTTKTERLFSDQSGMNSYIKPICDIMRRDKTKGAMQYIPELTWMMFFLNNS